MRRFAALALVLLSAELLDCQQAASIDSIPETTVIIDPVNAPWSFVPLGPGNATALVLEDEQPWIVYYHSGLLYQPFSDTAAQFKGLVQFGVAHLTDLETARMLNFAPDGKSQFQSLPFGSPDRKLAASLATDVFDAAVAHASNSVPGDSIVRLDSQEALTRLLADGAAAKPSKFTAIFTIRDVTPTLLHRVLAQKLSRVFNFGLITRAHPDKPLTILGLGDYQAPVPGLLVLQPKLDGAGVEVSRLDESGIASEDELLYPEVLRYLLEYNRRFRRELPGDNRADDEATVKLPDLLKRESLAFNVVDFSEHLNRARAAGAGAKDDAEKLAGGRSDL